MIIENIATPKSIKKANTNLSMLDIGSKLPKPTVDKVVKVKYKSIMTWLV